MLHTGPAQSLFKQEYYYSLKNALKPDGILCSQGECQWLHIDLIKKVMNFCHQLFPVAHYAYTTIPTYPSGQIGFILCSNSKVSLCAVYPRICVPQGFILGPLLFITMY